MIRKATLHDLGVLSALALQLWPEHTKEDLAEEFADSINQDSAHFFLLFEKDEAIGFAQCGLRHDYVEGTDSSPVGYLEGIFVKEDCRRKGYAVQLLSACEDWVRAQGCREFASDCELDNEMSLAFHLGAGFTEANRNYMFYQKVAIKKDAQASFLS